MPATIVEFTGKHGPCTIAEKAFCGAHNLGRKLMAQGQDERLKPPEYVHVCRRGGSYVFMDVAKDGIAPHEADYRALHRRVHTLS